MNLGMFMGIRIKASEDFDDILALNVVSGRIVGGKYPKFSFNSDIQRDAYDNIRKRLKGGESLESIRNTHTPSVK
ncbi:hypothetical protein PMSD_23025 [Paenibacillus macquariensis subsp. defensor]|nr:hypothetical protein PMSD_23025 [Paenibacillus macquariensis subsp. defensor]